MMDGVSDTARWVAVYRAMESARPDALFRDPYAARLAGERGAQVANLMDKRRKAAWALITRTHVFDELILDCVRGGVDLVLNLAAGLDARPWRLDLPADLRWVDADLPGILDEKTAALAAEKPRCRYEAVHIDLRDRPARRALFARLGAEARDVLVVSEGLLIYLQPGDVATLSEDLHAPPSFRRWLLDLASPAHLRVMKPFWQARLRKGGAPFVFAPEGGVGFFAEHGGWALERMRSQMEESERLGRGTPGLGLIKALLRLAGPDEVRRFASFVVLAR